MSPASIGAMSQGVAGVLLSLLVMTGCASNATPGANDQIGGEIGTVSYVHRWTPTWALTRHCRKDWVSSG